MPKYSTPATLRKHAFHRQLGRCYYCEQPMWLDDDEPFREQYGFSKGEARGLKCTAEHLVPRRAGGEDAPANIAAACLHCNSTRHRRRAVLEPAAYKQRVMGRLARGRWHSRDLLRRLRAVPHARAVGALNASSAVR